MSRTLCDAEDSRYAHPSARIHDSHLNLVLHIDQVIRHMLERSALQSDKSLLRLVIEMIQSLPLILEAVKDSKLPRVLKRLTAELDIPEEVRAAASELLDQWTAAAKQPVPGHVAKVSNTSRAEVGCYAYILKTLEPLRMTCLNATHLLSGAR